MDLHPSLQPLAWLVGTWRGEGSGHYPTVADFTYREEATWSHDGRPFLAYSQSTWAGDDGRPLHGERGFLRAPGELIIAHTFGIVEISVGKPGDPLVLTSTALTGSPTAKDVVTLRRRWWLDGGRLRYEIEMAAAGNPLQGHLVATLERVGSATPG